MHKLLIFRGINYSLIINVPQIEEQLLLLKAFTAKLLKNIVFNNLKHYFIYFKTSFYNIPNIKGFILTFNTLK